MNPTIGDPPPAPQEALLTRFLIYELIDGGKTLKLLGQQDARDRDQATKLFLGEPVREIVGDYVAISENAFKPKHVEIRPAARLSDLPLPAVDGPEPGEEQPQEGLLADEA